VFAGAAIGCPRCILDPASVAHMMARHGRITAEAPFDGNRLTATLGWYGRPWAYELVAALPYVLGVPVYLAALAGLVRAAMRRTLGDRLVLAMVVPYFVVVGGASVTFPRYLLVVVPGLVLLAARFAVELSRPWARTALIATAVAYSLALSATDVARLTWHQQDDVARFLADRVARAGATSPDAHVAFPNYGPYFRLEEPLTRVGLTADARLPGRWFEPRAPFFVMPQWYAEAIRRDRRDPVLSRDLDALESGASGYRPILRLDIPWYLQRALDERLDPAFATDLWQGSIGFTVYAEAAPGDDVR
jgi:hypothetical protein